MPRVNIYVRNEDWKKWEELSELGLIPNWLHVNLSSTVTTDFIKARYGKETISRESFVLQQDEFMEFSNNPSAEEKPTNLCPHFQSKGKCLVKGCKHGKK